MTRGVINLARRLLSFDGVHAPTVPDGVLLQRFLDERDQSAFTQLMERHAALVWGVCRRGLAHHVDAEDAFQATFLVLFQQAQRIRKQQALAAWLHGVAWRIVLKMKRSAMRRRQNEIRRAENEAKNGDGDHLLAEVLDAELADLPVRYREPVLLCYLQGQSHKAAAQTLGWPVGTVAGRLSRAKNLLRARLIRRGVAPVVAANVAIELAHAELPAGLIEKTLHTIQAGGTTTILALAKGAMGTMLITKWLMAGVVGVGLTLAAGVGSSAWQERKGETAAAQENAKLLAPVDKKEESDYQRIQGRWRWEWPSRITASGQAHDVQDLIFNDRKCTQVYYVVGSESRGGNQNRPREFILDEKRVPKRMELIVSDPKTSIYQGNDKPIADRVPERIIYKYELTENTLTLEMESYLPLRRNANRDIYGDRNNPITKDVDTSKVTYHRVKPNSNSLTDQQIKQVDAERKLVEQRVEAAEERFKLQYQAYVAGKEYLSFVLDSIRDRLGSKLELADTDQAQIKAALTEALDSAKEIEKIAEVKYKAGSATKLDLVTAQAARMDYELRLLRLEKTQLEKQPK